MELDPKSGFFHGWGSSLIFLFVTKICVPSTIFSIITFDWVINIVRQSRRGMGGGSRGAIAHLDPTHNSYGRTRVQEYGQVREVQYQ